MEILRRLLFSIKIRRIKNTFVLEWNIKRPEITKKRATTPLTFFFACLLYGGIEEKVLSIVPFKCTSILIFFHCCCVRLQIKMQKFSDFVNISTWSTLKVIWFVLDVKTWNNCWRFQTWFMSASLRKISQKDFDLLWILDNSFRNQILSYANFYLLLKHMHEQMLLTYFRQKKAPVSKILHP